MTNWRELEAKFDLDDTSVEQLLNLERFGKFRLVERESKHQNDLYYDTVDQCLKDAGASLRIRLHGSSTQMTFKGERTAVGDAGANIVSRLEDEVSVDADVLGDLSEAAPLRLQDEPRPLQRGREIAGDRALLPAARLLTERAVLLFTDTIGTQLELAVDRCTAIRIDDRREVKFAEAELELKQGDAETLVEAARTLQATIPGLLSSTTTKLQRALE